MIPEDWDIVEIQPLLSHKDIQEEIAFALKKLSQQERHIIEKLWLLDQDHSCKRVARELGVSNTYVQKVEKIAMEVMRIALENHF